MKVIFLSDNGRHHQKYTVNLWSHIIIPFLLLAIIVIVSLLIHDFSGDSKKQPLSSNNEKNKKESLKKLDVLLKKVSTLEAEIDRLNTLGKTIATNSDVDTAIFHLDQVPARGGHMATRNNHNDSKLDTKILDDEAELVENIKAIERRLERQKLSFKKLSNHPNHSKDFLTASFSDIGFYSSPVKKGYISSAYGKRRDPINGRQRHHNGIDIAAKLGTEINTIGSGFVTFAGRKGGYGKVIEIRHSNSLKSRYAHLHNVLVNKGDVVRKGDKIATMGRTGRATGSHLHLEVWENDRPTNPEDFIKIALKNLKK